MNKGKTVLFIIIVLLLVAFVSSSCAGAKYEIKLYLKGEVPASINSMSDGLYKELVIKIATEGTLLGTYKASKIINYTGISAWFIDEEGEEQFVTADRVEINKIE